MLRSLVFAIVASLGLAHSGVAHAMHVRRAFTPVAYSDDSASVLVYVEANGPEGGGSEGYEIWGALVPTRVAFALSSDFSPGDATRPQRIDLGTCAQHLRELDMALKQRGFHDVAVQPNACKTRRGGYVKTSKTVEDRMHGAGFTLGKDGSFSREGYRVAKKGSELTVSQGNKVLCTLKVDLANVSEIEVAGVQPGRLVYVSASYAYGDRALLGLCAAGDGGKLQPVPIQ